MSISEEDIQILLDQTQINRELAKKLIVYKRGDLVECILELESCSDLEELEKKIDLGHPSNQTDDIEPEVDVSNQDNLKEYRSIVDEKDTIYNYKAKLKEEQKKKNQEIEERRQKCESVDHLLEKKLCNESIYYTRKKGTFNNIKVL